MWGLLPIYWKWLDYIPSEEVLAHRIIWSLLFMGFLLTIIGKGPSFLSECKLLVKQPKLLVAMICASLLITCNWFTYIWAVAYDHVVEASLGYYINPLISVLLGVLFLKERLLKLQWAAVCMAAAAVMMLTLMVGAFPYIAISLAISFGLYGLIKKTVQTGALSSVAIESLLTAPIAVSFLLARYGLSSQMFYFNDGISFWLLAGTGVASATPLLLFAAGAKRIPLSMIGFLQYIAPTMMLLLGIFVYKETFTTVHFTAYSFIWVALLLFAFSQWHSKRRKAKKHLPPVTATAPTALSEAGSR